MKLSITAFAMALSWLAFAHQDPNKLRAWGGARKRPGSSRLR